MSPWEETVRDLARRTLSRDPTDLRPVPGPYLVALSQLIQRYPNELNFLMQLEEEGGTITCLDCWEDVPCGFLTDAEEQTYAFGGLGPWERHTRLASHQDGAAERYQQILQPSQQLSATVSPPTTKSAVATQANSGSPSSKAKKTITFPDGEIVEISDDDDDEIQEIPRPLASQRVQPAQQPPLSFSNPSAAPITASTPSRSVVAPQPAKKRVKKRTVFGDGEVVEWSSDEDVEEIPSVQPQAALVSQAKSEPMDIDYPPQASSSISPFQHTPDAYSSYVRDPASGPSRPQAVASAKSNVKRKRYVFDDAVIELTDDEDDEQSGNSTASNGSLSLKRAKIESTAYGASVTPAPPSFLRPEGSSVPVVVKSETWIPGAWPGSSHSKPPADPVGAVAQGYNHVDAGGMPHMNIAGPSGAKGPPIADLYSQSGFNMNYDNESPIRSIDIGGADQAQKVQEFIAQAAKDDDDRLESIDHSAQLLGLQSRDDILPGMEISLMKHQLMGVAWMVKQEEEYVRGGILADDMGLGKTVQSIALIVKRPPDTPETHQGTLIVAPAALLQQWKTEIIQRTQEGLFRVHIHHGSDKLKSMAQVKRYDIVITTYQTLCGDFPKRKKKGKNLALEQPDENEVVLDDLDAPTGPLGKTSWHRIILDEAQIIRNRNTRASICVALMEAKHRWCLTGTPVTNSLVDLYGLTRFLKFRPWNDWKFFNDQIGKVQKKRVELAGQRSQIILKKTLLRRTKNTRLEGKAIFELEPKTIDVVYVDFTDAERAIYSAIEAGAKIKVNKFIKAGTLMKNYAFILVMILRCRQACNHPKLVAYQKGEVEAGEGEGVLAGDSDDEDGVHADPLAGDEPATIRKRAARDVGAEFVSQLQDVFRKRAIGRMTAEANGKEFEEEGDEDCPICFDAFNATTCVLTPCKHRFCSECIYDVLNSPLRQADADDQAAMANSRPCPVCRQAIDKKRIYKASAFEPTGAELEVLQHSIKKSSSWADDDNSSPEPPSALFKGKGKGKAKAEPADDLDIGDLDLDDEPIEPSTKMLKMLEYVKAWIAEFPDDQMICYSQWTSMIDLVVDMLRANDIEALRFDGKMSRQSREETLTKFKSKNGPRILIISLKCGGVGLNLVNANRCINLDLAWNRATEDQAIDRCYRIGQKKAVLVKRIVVRGTIEERILKLQDAKQSLANAALGEGGVLKNGKMSMNDIKALFSL